MAAVPSGDEEKQNPFVLLNDTAMRHQTNTKRLSFDSLFDTDNLLSHPIDRSPVRSGSRFVMIFTIGVKSYMRVTNVTLDSISFNIIVPSIYPHTGSLCFGAPLSLLMHE